MTCRAFKFAIAAAITFAVTFYHCTPARAETLTIFAAASLSGAFEEIAGLYRTEHPSDRVELSFAGSQVLRTQIEQGARTDVFASADPLHMTALRQRGLIGVDSVFARNRLVVITPASDSTIRKLADLERSDTRLVIADARAPLGRYTQEMIDKLDRGLRDGFRKRVFANLVSLESSARGVLAKVALGEADAGVVYRSDAEGARGSVRRIEIPEVWNVVSDYPIAVLTESRSRAAARAFVALVLEARGRAILERHGFELAP